MSMQSFIMSRPKLAKWFMSTRSANFWKKQGEKRALRSFKLASRRVKAYQAFLKEHKIKPDTIQTIEDFKKLPIIDKKKYIQKYPIMDLALDGSLYDKYTIEKSSGQSGKSSYWPRTAEEDAMFPQYIEFAFVQFYGIDKKETLVILTLALGTWTSGEKMGEALRKAAQNKNYKMTVMTPGANLEEVVDIVNDLSDKYEQTIIVGYPPFIKSAIDEGARKGIDWKKLNVKLGLGGEGYSEVWREYMAKKIGLNQKDLLGISGGYGAADVGMTVGREYPFTVLLRKLAHKNKKLAKDLFGEDEIMPSLLQYSSSTFYIEAINGELVFTSQPGIPIVRYNIHDRGGVITFNDAVAIAKKHGYDVIKMLKEDYGYEKGDIWTMPLFYVFGRSDGTISIDGANIYPENVEMVLYNRTETMMVHAYKLGLKHDDDMNARPIIYVELNKDIPQLSESETIKTENILHDVFLPKLLEQNKDFKKSYNDNPKNADPIINIYQYAQGPFETDDGKIKRKYVVK